jgi:hypothetical protein
MMKARSIDALRLDGRNRRVTCSLRFDLYLEPEVHLQVLAATAPQCLRIIGDLDPQDVLAAASAGRNIVIPGRGTGDRRSVPPSSVLALARWLRALGAVAAVPVGGRSRPSALAARLA